MNQKKGQTQISFGMIFSVILIIGFIAFAVWGIKKFLDVSDFAQAEKFKSDFQADIDNMWTSTQGSQALEYALPKKIGQVCFEDGEFENMYFLPLNSDYKGILLKNVDIAKTVRDSTSRPKKLCVESAKGKIRLTIKKAYNENTVTITR